MSTPSPSASTLELLTYILGKLEALNRELGLRESDVLTGGDPLDAEFRLLGELARRLWPRDDEGGDPDFTLIMRKREAIANLLAQRRQR